MIWNKAKPKSRGRKNTKSSTIKKTKASQKVRKLKKEKVVTSTKKQVLVSPIKKEKTRPLTVVGKPVLEQIFSNVNAIVPAKNNIITRLTKGRDEILNEKMSLAFRQLHHEFNQREKQLEIKLQEIQLQHDALQGRVRSKWLIPMALAVALAGGYMLYVLTNMQNSMSSMTGSINNMNGYMSNMSSNTQAMSQNMQAMNNSMYYMNGNVNKMTQAIEPMGEAAQTISPFAKAFKSFMPF